MCGSWSPASCWPRRKTAPCACSTPPQRPCALSASGKRRVLRRAPPPPPGTTSSTDACGRRRELLVAAHQGGRLCSLAVDEAHCVMQWGHGARARQLCLGWRTGEIVCRSLPQTSCCRCCTCCRLSPRLPRARRVARPPPWAAHHRAHRHGHAGCALVHRAEPGAARAAGAVRLVQQARRSAREQRLSSRQMPGWIPLFSPTRPPPSTQAQHRVRGAPQGARRRWQQRRGVGGARVVGGQHVRGGGQGCACGGGGGGGWGGGGGGGGGGRTLDQPCCAYVRRSWWRSSRASASARAGAALCTRGCAPRATGWRRSSWTRALMRHPTTLGWTRRAATRHRQSGCKAGSQCAAARWHSAWA